MIAILKDDFFAKNLLPARLEKSKILNAWNVLLTFHLATFAWIFFRAESTGDAFTIIKNIGNLSMNGDTFKDSIFFFADNPKNFGRIIFLIALGIAFLALDPIMDKVAKRRTLLPHPFLRYGLYATIVACIVLIGYFGEVSFIYFQF
jgi:hypothetical protein